MFNVKIHQSHFISELNSSSPVFNSNSSRLKPGDKLKGIKPASCTSVGQGTYQFSDKWRLEQWNPCSKVIGLFILAMGSIYTYYKFNDKGIGSSVVDVLDRPSEDQFCDVFSFLNNKTDLLNPDFKQTACGQSLSYPSLSHLFQEQEKWEDAFQIINHISDSVIKNEELFKIVVRPSADLEMRLKAAEAMTVKNQAFLVLAQDYLRRGDDTIYFEAIKQFLPSQRLDHEFLSIVKNHEFSLKIRTKAAQAITGSKGREGNLILLNEFQKRGQWENVFEMIVNLYTFDKNMAAKELVSIANNPKIELSIRLSIALSETLSIILCQTHSRELLPFIDLLLKYEKDEVIATFLKKMSHLFGFNEEACKIARRLDLSLTIRQIAAEMITDPFHQKKAYESILYSFLNEGYVDCTSVIDKIKNIELKNHLIQIRDKFQNHNRKIDFFVNFASGLCTNSMLINYAKDSQTSHSNRLSSVLLISDIYEKVRAYIHIFTAAWMRGDYEEQKHLIKNLSLLSDEAIALMRWAFPDVFQIHEGSFVGFDDIEKIDVRYVESMIDLISDKFIKNKWCHYLLQTYLGLGDRIAALKIAGKILQDNPQSNVEHFFIAAP